MIVKADNTEIKSADDLIAFLGTKKPGDTITVTVERDGKTQESRSRSRNARATSDAESGAGGAVARRPPRRGAAPAFRAASHFFG